MISREEKYSLPSCGGRRPAYYSSLVEVAAARGGSQAKKTTSRYYSVVIPYVDSQSGIKVGAGDGWKLVKRRRPLPLFFSLPLPCGGRNNPTVVLCLRNAALPPKGPMYGLFCTRSFWGSKFTSLFAFKVPVYLFHPGRFQTHKIVYSKS